MKKYKKRDKGDLFVAVFLFIGIGTGFLLMDKFSMAIPAFTLIGLGFGIGVSILVNHWVPKKKK